MSNELYKNKYRIKSARLPGWDYRNNAAYFITINTYKHFHFFGKIENGKSILNKSGKITEEYIKLIPKFNLYTQIDILTVMPNHIHFILTLFNPNKQTANFVYIDNNAIENIVNNNCGNVAGRDVAGSRDVAGRDVAVQRLYNNNNNDNDTAGIIDIRKQMSKISPKSGSVSLMMRTFKYAVKKYIRKKLNIADFDWQERFHDHIIRNKHEYRRIYNYIKYNPKNWNNDRFNIK